MQILRRKAFARAGLVGNPSDGYNGKTLSIIVRNYWAEVVLYEWEDVELIPSQEDQSRFRSIRELAHDVDLHGYYGGIRLVKATIKRFVDYCDAQDVKLHDRNFSVRYSTNIPRQVGLAGSSAIIVATLRALMDFYQVQIPEDVQPSLVLSVEMGELGIAAGLQDRVIQVYEGLVFMDFAKDRMQTRDGFVCGTYERIDPALLPPLYIAFSNEAGEPTEIVHGPLRARYERGDEEVVAAMVQFAQYATDARQAIFNRDPERLAKIIDANFDLRRSICDLPALHVQMIEEARKVGASAKFAGSGGAIIGTYQDDAMYRRLREALGKIGCQVIRPLIQAR